MPNPKLTKKPSDSGNSAVQLQMPPAQVNVRVPEIKVPQINVPESKVNVDMSAVAEAIESLAIAVNQIAQQHTMMLQEMAQNRQMIAELSKNAPKVEVAAPVVKMPTRPRSYSVEIEDEKGDVTTMTIEANSPN